MTLQEDRERLQKSIKVEAARVEAPDFPTNINAQFAVVQFVSRWRREPIAALDCTRLGKQAAIRLGISWERFKLIEQIEKPREIRRALRAVQKRPKSPRLAGEEIYPDTGWLGAFLDFSEDSEVPLGWHFWCGVSLLGAACRDNIYIDRGRFYIFPNHYMILVGDSASHKSTAITNAMPVFQSFNRILEQEMARTHHDKRVVQLSSKTTPEGMIDDLLPYTKYDERMRPTIRTQSAGFLQQSELSVLLGKNVMGADRMVHLLTDLYGFEGSEYGFRTRKDGRKVLVDPIISCLFGTTARWINTSMTTDMFDGGYVGRNMWLSRNTSIRDFPKPPPMDPVIRDQLAAWMAPWALTTSTELELTGPAEKWFEGWYRHNKSRRPPIPILEGWKQRKQGHLFKLATVLCVSDKCTADLDQDALDNCPSMELSLEVLQRAAEIIDMEEERMPDCFAQIGQHQSSEIVDYVKHVLAEMCRLSPDGWVRHSDLARKCRTRIGNSVEFRKIMATLIDTEEVEPEHAGKGTRYRIKPE